MADETAPWESDSTSTTSAAPSPEVAPWETGSATDTEGSASGDSISGAMSEGANAEALANEQLAGALPNLTVGGVTGVAAKLAGRVVDALPPSKTLGTGADWDKSIPSKAEEWGDAGARVAAAAAGTPGAQFEQGISKTSGALAQKLPGYNTPLGQTLYSAGGEALNDIGLLEGPLSAAARIRGPLADVGTFDPASIYTHPDEMQPPEAPPKVVPGPVTATDLKASPERLPAAPAKRVPAAATPPEGAPATDAAPASAAPGVRVPGKPHIRLKAGATPAAVPPEPAAAAPPEAVAPAPSPLTAPKTDEEEISGGADAVPGDAEQKARLSAIQQLQADTGAVMPNVRRSAVTGDFRETGTDYQLGEMGADLGDTGMRDQLDQEQHALRAASRQQIDQSGGVADGTGQPALRQRGQIIDRALQGIGDWFDTHVRGLYQAADRQAAGRPFTLNPNPQTGVGAFDALMNDHSQFTGVEGHQLHQDAQRVAQQFGLTGSGGFWSPTTVQNAERFRQWLGEQYTPRTGRTIGRMKDALDADVAAHGGGGLYEQARALRFKRDQMLGGVRGIQKLLPEKRPDGTIVSRPVALEDIADHVTNMPTDEFNHLINVLHDSAKLGKGELADANAAAINEIRRHIAERLHEAGTKSDDKFWNAKAYHQALDNYSTKLPAVYSPESIRRFGTIHDAGNALRVNKRYGGAVKQLLQTGGLSAESRKRIASAVEDLALGWLGPAKGPLLGITGVSGKLREGIERRLPGGNIPKKTGEVVSGRLQPLGQRIYGGRQGGWIGDLRKSKLPDVTHEYDPESRTHTVKSANGYTEAQQRGNDIQITNTHTEPGASGKGEGVARLARLADEAHARGGVLQSDTSVSTDGQKVYPALAHLGYDVKKNPEVTATDSDAYGRPALESDNGRPVFTVGPPKRPSLRQGYDPGAGLFDAQVQRDVAAAHARPGAARPPLRQGDDSAQALYEAQARADANRPHAVGGPRTLSGKFPGQRGGPKFERQAGVAKAGGKPAEYEASPALNEFIRAHAPAHVVDPNGPASWDELKARGHESPMPVNPQEAEGSIYKDTPTNIAFRAWHDSLHLKHDAGFDHEGELRTALAHQEEAKAAGLSPQDRAALWADTWKTFEHHERTGQFPKNPRQFVHRVLAADKPESKLNIGLHVGDPDNGGHFVEPDEAVRKLREMGYKVGKTSIVESNTEPTLVADIHGAPVTASDLHALSQHLEQGAIAQRLNDGSGMLEGPQAKEWGGEYNPDYFRMHDGKTAIEHDLPARSTVTNSQRTAYPGIYDTPKRILSRVTTAPEDPALKELFGVTRKDLHDVAMTRDSSTKYELPGAAKKRGPRGSAAAEGVMNDKNAQRLVDIINEAKKHPDLYHGMVGWYVMDPLYKKVAEVVGEKAAPGVYSRLNHLMGMASPGSDVETEINRGTAAHMMATQGKFDKFLRYGGRPEGSRGKPKELAAVRGHPYHSTAQGAPMRKYLESGELQMKSPKVPTYIAASALPEAGGQSHILVGDSHWSRGVGLSDTRTAKDYAGSVSNPEIQQLHPWYREKVAQKAGIPATSAQAVQWGALSHETGVETPVGAPKLELFAKQVKKAAARLGISPEEALREIILGNAHAG